MNPGDLDDKYLPLAAARVGALADQLAGRRDGVVTLARSLDRGALRALDARYAGSGPFALLRDVPQVGFVLIAAVFLAAAGTAVSQESARNRAAQHQVVVGASPGATAAPGGDEDNLLGPEVGETTTAYEAAAARGLAQAVAGSPDSTRIALVSFTAYQTPTQLAALVKGYPVRRVFLRARAAGRDAAQLPVEIRSDLQQELRKAYTATALGRLEAQKSYQGYVDSLVVTSKEEQAFKDLYAAFAKTTGIEAREYQRSCACVYSVVVEAKAAQLAALRAQPGVRAIEVAGRGLALPRLQILPLLPEVRGVVPKQQAGVDAQP